MGNIWRTIHIGERLLSGNVGLAPMAGTSDLVFRTIAAEMGSSMGFTELVSARGIRFDPSLSRCYRYLEVSPEREGPVGIQLFGYDPADFETAIPILLRHPVLGKTWFIDINMGCPVMKVTKTGAGSALMKTPELAAEILRASVSAALPFHVPITVKFRKGWDERSANAREFARRCIDAGVSAMTVHARTKEQMYGGKADWETIAQVADIAKGTGAAVFGNGDVSDGESAVRMMEETGADGVIVGRAAQGNPWVFREIKNRMQGGIEQYREPSLQERIQILLRHTREYVEKIGERQGVAEMRAQFAYYLKGQKNSAKCKTALMGAATVYEVEEILGRWLQGSL